MGSFTTAVTPEGPNSNLGITASKWGTMREMSHDAEMVPKAGVSAPTSSTMLPVRNELLSNERCGNLRSERDRETCSVLLKL